jgi:hypothetical protein
MVDPRPFNIINAEEEGVAPPIRVYTSDVKDLPKPHCPLPVTLPHSLHLDLFPCNNGALSG